jgi:hypothetical protein
MHKELILIIFTLYYVFFLLKFTSNGVALFTYLVVINKLVDLSIMPFYDNKHVKSLKIIS